MLSPSPIELLPQVAALVREAGNAALSARSSLKVEYKSDSSLVTQVDRQTEKFLEERLSRAAPGWAFFGEEYGRRGPETGPVWCVDPIDGTTNYVRGLPHWCVSVGLLHNGRSLLGAIYAPVLDELYTACAGHGADLNGVPLHCTDRDTLHFEDTVVLTSNAAKTLNPEAVTGRIRCLGSIALEMVNAAADRVCAVVGLREGIVDIAAAVCICQEAGCEIGYLDGTEVLLEALLEKKRTYKHFVYAPPKMLRHLRGVLQVRHTLPSQEQ
jgi:fructose-1,6-bisphosphatase/inositol monophosphatase family enzyme